MTGATDGIGLALAKEIAKKGVNVVLVSRSMDKLKVSARANPPHPPRVWNNADQPACLPGGRCAEHCAKKSVAKSCG